MGDARRTADVRFLARLGPAAGLMFVVLMFTAILLGPEYAGVRPDDPAARIAEDLVQAQPGFQRQFWALLLAVFFFTWFLGDLQQRFRDGVPAAGQWVVSVFWAGGLLFAGGMLVGELARGGLFTLGEPREDVQAARALFALSWDTVPLLVPGLAAMTGAVAIIVLRFRALPTWLGAIALLAFLATFGAFWFPPAGLPFAVAWVLATSIMLLVAPQATTTQD